MTLTTTPGETDLVAPPNRAPLPDADTDTDADTDVNSGGIKFTPVETRFLTLFGKTKLFEGLGLALREIVECLMAAHLLFGLDRLGLWAVKGATFAIRIDQLEKPNRTWLGLPSTSVQDLTSGDLLSNLPDPSLEPNALQRAKAMLGLRAARHLSIETALPNEAVKSHESLLVCQAARARQQQDWRTLSEQQELDDTGLNALRPKLKSQIVRGLVDELLVALSTAIKAPGPDAEAPANPAAEGAEGDVKDPDEDDDPDGIYDPPTDQEVEAASQEPADGAAKADTYASGSAEGPDGKTEKKAQKFSLLGWRAIDAMRAPFTRRLGIAHDWGALPLEDYEALCRRLKHAFLTGEPTTRNYVFLAYQSQQWSLPPQLALTVPCDTNAPTHYNVASGRRVWRYSGVIGKDTAAEPESGVEHLTCTPIELEIDPDLAAYGRTQFEAHPDATSIAGIVEAGNTPEENRQYLKGYRTFLRSMGDSAHPAYAGRVARSHGPAVKRITDSDVLAVFLATDSSMVAGGMPHYVTLTAGLLAAWNKKVHSQLGWRAPLGPPDESDEPVGAGIGLAKEPYAQGWAGLQLESAEVLAQLAAANSLEEIAAAWTSLARTRLLSFGCLSGHRLTRIARLTADALFGCIQYICLSDKVTSLYDSYRLLPVTARLVQFRECLQGDLEQLQQAIDRVDTEASKAAVVAAAPAKAIFFGLKTVLRNGRLRLKREALAPTSVDALSQKHFKRDRNIGRHTLVSMLVSGGVDTWLIRILTGHSAALAEAFGDATAAPARDLLAQLKHALDKCLEDSRFEPYRSPGAQPAAIKFTRLRALPSSAGDPYVHPAMSFDGHLLPPPADRYSTVSLTVLDVCRERLLVLSKKEKDRRPWVEWLLSGVAFDGLHHLDLQEIFERLPASLASLGSAVLATWTRSGRNNLTSMPWLPPTLAALARCSMSDKPCWSALVAESGRWLKDELPELAWPEDAAEAFLSFIAMSGRWLRVHLSPAAHAASLRCVMSSSFSAHSLLRLAQGPANPPPVDALSTIRLIRPGSSRKTSIKKRPSIHGIGTVLFRYQKTDGERHGENEARANKILEDLASHDISGDLPATAALMVVRKEMHLILDHDPSRRDVGGLATYWTELALSLKLVPACEDMRHWSAADFTSWIEISIAAIKADAIKYKKKGAPELGGLIRFLKMARLLGWEVPPWLGDGEDIYKQDGMRLSAASTVLLANDFEVARPIVRHALRHHPLAQQRADLLLDFFKVAPCRIGELSTLLANCVTPASRRLCVQPAGHSAMKNALAPRLVPIPEPVADRVLGTNGAYEDIDALGAFLFLDDKGNDWGLLEMILATIQQALLLITGDIHFRFHATRASAGCRIAYPDWENWARALMHGTTGANFGGKPLGVPRDAVAQAIAAIGHGRTSSFLGYYAPVWPWIKAHELRLTLHSVSLPVAFENALFGNTDARRTAVLRARKRGQQFDIWDWIGQQMVKRIAAPALRDDQPPVVIANEEEGPSQTPAVRALTQYGLMRLIEVSAAAAGHKCGLDAFFADAVDDALALLAPSLEAVWERRGQPRGERGKNIDERLALGKVGRAFVEHFVRLSVDQLTLLKSCLDVDRGRLLLLSSSNAEHQERIRELSKCIPPGVAKLYVREPLNAPLNPDPRMVEALKATVAFGDPERDVGQHPLFQVEPVELPTKKRPKPAEHNRKRIGPFTGLARATCIAALAAHNALKGEK